MFKVVFKKTKQGIKSADIYDIWKFVNSHTGEQFQFYYLNRKISNESFLKLFLSETKNYISYLRLCRAIHNPLTLIDYALKEYSKRS